MYRCQHDIRKHAMDSKMTEYNDNMLYPVW